jgi:hypothetical protein
LPRAVAGRAPGRIYGWAQKRTTIRAARCVGEYAQQTCGRKEHAAHSVPDAYDVSTYPSGKRLYMWQRTQPMAGGGRGEDASSVTSIDTRVRGTGVSWC